MRVSSESNRRTTSTTVAAKLFSEKECASAMRKVKGQKTRSKNHNKYSLKNQSAVAGTGSAGVASFTAAFRILFSTKKESRSMSPIPTSIEISATLKTGKE